MRFRQQRSDAMTAWPKDNQAARNAFYGDPGRGEIAKQMVPVTPPFAMYYEGRRIKSIMFHRKAAPALAAALAEIWDYCQHDQARIDAAGVSKYAGAYNHRLVRGSSSKWSNHAYAAAIDLNAEQNGLYAKGNMPQFVIDAFCRQGAMWGGWYNGRKDPMHFEFVDNGGRKPSSPKPVWPRPVAHLLADPADDADAQQPELIDGADAVLVSVQARLKAMNYNPGVVGTGWGGMTAGAISGFVNDRNAAIPAPTSAAAFAAGSDAIVAEIDAAEAEGFTRPVSAGRADADPKVVAEIAPEVVPAKRSALAAAWGAVATFFVGLWQTVSVPVMKAWDFFTGHKDDLPDIDSGTLASAAGFLAAIPPIVWVFGLAGLLGIIWWQSRQSAAAITESVKTGARA